ncbi:MAG: hypothetical protein ABIF87_06210 [Pseudomonadota bacterium]
MSIAFVKGIYQIGQGNTLAWTRVRNPSPRGLIFLPPLIGGNLSQQIGMFRWLTRNRYDLISFNYSGHGNSSGKFSLRATLRDTLHMLQYAYSLSKKEQLPLLGIASCYSAIPLLYAAYRLKEPLGGVVLINAVLKLSPGAVLRSFWAHYRKMIPARVGIKKILTAIIHYADFMFPGIKKGKECFGLLERERVRLFNTLADFFTLDPLKRACLQNTPVLCLYASQDRILDIYDGGVRINYKNEVRRICPLTRFSPLDGNHFLALRATRDRATKYIDSFLNLRVQSSHEQDKQSPHQKKS